MKRFLAIFVSLGIGLCIAGGFCAQNEPCQDEKTALRSEEPWLSDNKYIVTWGADADAAAHCRLMAAEPVEIEYDDEMISVITVDDSCPDEDMARVVERIGSIAGVVAVEKDSPVTLTDLTYQVVIPSYNTLHDTVSDYFAKGEYWLHNTGSYEHIEGNTRSIVTSTEDIDIDAPEGWFLYDYYDIEKRPVTVAVVDTGIDYLHPELANRMWINEGEIPGNGIDDDGNGYIDDVYGWDFYNQDDTVCHYEYNDNFKVFLADPLDCDDHGTHVAGLIAAEANNAIGIAGVAGKADVRLMSLKIHGGTNRAGSVSDAIVAIRYATKMGADICNISWGTYTQSKALYSVIKASPMLFVCAAGNNGTNNDLYPLYPASYDLDNIISVTYTDANGRLTYDSNYGAISVDVAVPATDVFSTVVGTYSNMSGSSMAAPQVSGMAALAYSFGEGLYAKEVKQIILDSAKYDVNTVGSIAAEGIPSMRGMLERIDSLEYDVTPPTFTVTENYAKEYLEVVFSAEDEEGGSGIYSMCYYVGEKNESDFGNGVFGAVVTDNRINVSKAGKYTFFVMDASGNKTIKVVNIIDDYIGPRFGRLTYKVNADSSFTISGNVTDLESGIKSLKYLKGRHSINEFLTGSNVVVPDDNGEFNVTVETSGLYTFCAQDHRGNRTVETIMIYKRPATGIRFEEEMITLEVGGEYIPAVTTEPVNATDKIKYVSVNEAIASVDNMTGRIEAKSVGEVEIFAVTESGPEAHVTVMVTEPAVSEEAKTGEDAESGTETVEKTDPEESSFAEATEPLPEEGKPVG